MRVLRVDPERPQPEAIAAAAEVLRAGGLVALPTETVYGLGANALDPAAIERIFAAKGRPAYNPLIAHCATIEEARRLADPWPAAAERLGTRFWPGPLTLVVPKAAGVPDRLTAGLPTVAIRVPRHPVALALLRAVDFPIAAPSANPFTRLSPTASEHVERGLSGRVDLVLDAGPAALGIESTVVDLSGSRALLLRPGSLGISEIEAALGTSLGRPEAQSGDTPRPGPGMIARHYSPRAHLILVEEGQKPTLPAALADPPARTALLAMGDADPASADRVVRMPTDPAEYGRVLYATLHELDAAGFEVVLVEAPPPDPAWAAVRDRLTRASHSS